jgi:ribosomal protein S6--L-glutamate ligase
MRLDKIIIGKEEWCSLPLLCIESIKVRVDTGAKTSAIHAINIMPFKKEGVRWVRYEVHPIEEDDHITVECESRIVGRRRIKSTNGEADVRYIVASTLSISGHSWDIELSLANRDAMGYRMLLGRQAMAGKVLVDPQASFLQGEP